MLLFVAWTAKTEVHQYRTAATAMTTLIVQFTQNFDLVMTCVPKQTYNAAAGLHHMRISRPSAGSTKAPPRLRIKAGKRAWKPFKAILEQDYRKKAETSALSLTAKTVLTAQEPNPCLSPRALIKPQAQSLKPKPNPPPLPLKIKKNNRSRPALAATSAASGR